MKRYFVTLVFALVCSVAAMAQSQKTFVKSIPAETASALELQVPGEVTVKEWDKDFIRVSVTVDLLNSNEEILKRLASVGRYDVQTRMDGNNLIVEMPKMEQIVSIKGVQLQEVLKVEVMYPSGMNVNVDKPAYQKKADTF